ncbi:50S ribosomal protein L16 [Methanocella arvoryzae]|uniref:Large ribosomal subunit protein uL16 n=1 Tax=Methanocella arvoryzae (strain DSM 22066 / NBRC 105507 / MRE50) TaxID=351160 RepID=RL10E_METAR|nr:50S ribosomal protein L16 [Methanocella arvoryzae]Q0W389.1 RecName: Full=Large ribosomal subunit protein uL16; AltName: Full=50S ribosomal protein L10e [Methanocella arvoryzae MRE50]CAJ37154.1 50S ribosomal protein L10E [Methanocella arvoryzae MRE50]
MARKPGRMYKKFSGPAYTRREYMGGVPGVKVAQFDMGNLTEELPIAVTLVVNETCQIRHDALEAARISANRYLLNDVGKTNYRFKVRVYPHQVLRENKQATGAGADRVSDGMRRAFGKAVGTAARVYEGQGVFTIWVNRANFEKAKEAMRRAGHKLPTPYRVVVEKGAELVK